MRGTIVLIFFLAFLAASCAKKDNEVDCITDKVEELDMILYTGQEIGCEFFLELYEYKNKQYFLLGSHCADIESNPFDCDGNQLCGREDNGNCNDFFENAKRIRVIGIGK